MNAPSSPPCSPLARGPSKRRGWLSAVAGMTIFCMSASSFADSDLPAAYWANRQLPDTRQEAKAAALMEELRCLVCQGQSIADSDAELAGDMRDLVRRRIAAGERPEAVRGWLVQRYGSWITYRPPAEPLTWPLWLLPLALLGVGALLVGRRIAWKKNI